MVYRKLYHLTIGDSLRLGASPLSLYSEQKSRRFDAVTCHPCLRNDPFESKDGMTIRKKLRTTISFLRRPKKYLRRASHFLEFFRMM